MEEKTKLRKFSRSIFKMHLQNYQSSRRQKGSKKHLQKRSELIKELKRADHLTCTLQIPSLVTTKPEEEELTKSKAKKRRRSKKTIEKEGEVGRNEKDTVQNNKIASNAMMDMIRDDLDALNIHHDVFFSERTLHDNGEKAIRAAINIHMPPGAVGL